VYWKTPNLYEMWTSGTADGIGCERTWGWCPSGQLFYENFTWGNPLYSAPGVKNCASLTWSTVQPTKFADQLCSKRLPFICEVKNKIIFVVSKRTLYFKICI
jgi:hypothetical protein